MPGLYGADVEQLRSLAKTMSRHSEGAALTYDAGRLTDGM